MQNKLICWYCCYTMDKPLIGIPKSKDSKNKKIYVNGYFCSFECV